MGPAGVVAELGEPARTEALHRHRCGQRASIGHSLGSKSGHASAQAASLQSLQAPRLPCCRHSAQTSRERLHSAQFAHLRAGFTAFDFEGRPYRFALTSRVTVEALTSRRRAIADALRPASRPSCMAHLSS